MLSRQEILTSANIIANRLFPESWVSEYLQSLIICEYVLHLGYKWFRFIEYRKLYLQAV
jgi:hypothetical protein